MDGFKRPSQPLGPATPRRPAAVEYPAPAQSSVPAPRPVQESMPSAVPNPVLSARASAPEPAPRNPTVALQPPLASPSLTLATAKRRRKPLLIWLVAAAVLAVAAAGSYIWYEQSLRPVNADDQLIHRFEVKDGTTFNEVATQLQQRGLIRDPFAFDIYARLHGKRGTLKASTCSLTPAMSAGAILDKLSAGCHDFTSVMFYPGATIEKPLYKPADSTIDQEKMYIKYVLKGAGFSDQDIARALNAHYTSPLFEGKPDGTSLEGYIFGETYYVDKSATAEDVLKEAFAHMYSVIQKNDIVAKYKTQNLNLYQGITLASIVQRELNCEDKPTKERKDRCYGYQQTIAQIFLKRLREGISLGSDVTFIYAADMLKKSPSVDIESRYNTRKYPGLPPGPIASPGELALKAVANPSDTDYLYFIAGDDGLIYFAKDEAGHQRNIEVHCQKMCGNAV